jgi:peptide/nickel transport system substrate-binding protein
MKRWAFLVCALLFSGSMVFSNFCFASQVIISQGNDAATLDPHQTTTMSDYNVINHVCDGLVRRDLDMKIIPDLAESWKTIDSLTHEFKLRRGVKFHNGEPFNAQVVKFNIERIFDPKLKSRVKTHIEFIDRVEVVDEYTVRIVTKEPSPIILNQLLTVSIIPPKYVKEKGDQYVARNPVGTGPYRFVEWVKDDHIILEAYNDYWRGKPPFDRVIFKPIPEDSTRVAALLTGEVDIITNVPPTEINRLKGAKNVHPITIPSVRCMFVKLNTEKPPFNNKWVRQALNYAVDKEAIVDSLFEGKAKILNGQVISPEYFGYNPALKPYPYDPQKAKELLAKGGYPDGFEVEFDTPSGRYLLDREVSQAIAGQLLRLGVKAKVTVLEWGLFMKKYVGTHNLAPMALIGFGHRTVDADGQYTFFSTESPYSYYSNKEVDKLLMEGRSTLDPSKRMEIYKEVSESLREDAVIVFLYQQADIYGVSEKFKWWKPRADENIWMFQFPPK